MITSLDLTKATDSQYNAGVRGQLQYLYYMLNGHFSNFGIPVAMHTEFMQ
jgi:hypothetical protein